MIKINKILVFWLLCICLLAFSGPAIGNQKLSTADQNRIVINISKDRAANIKYRLFNVVRLGDIADITGDDKELITKIASVEIVRGFPADLTKHVAITKKQVLARIRRKGIDLKDINIISHKKIIISRRYLTIDKDRIKRVIEDFLYNRLMLSREDVTVAGVIADEINLPEGDISFDILSRSNDIYSGHASFRIQISVDNRFWKNIQVNAFINEFRDVVVNSKDVKKGDVASEEDILFKRMNVTDLQGNFYTNKEEVIGKKYIRNMKLNEIVKKRDIKDFYILKSGDRVMILAESPIVKVSTRGIAKENGKKGDRIKVLNIHSNKYIIGRIVDAQTVAVEF